MAIDLFSLIRFLRILKTNLHERKPAMILPMLLAFLLGNCGSNKGTKKTNGINLHQSLNERLGNNHEIPEGEDTRLLSSKRNPRTKPLISLDEDSTSGDHPSNTGPNSPTTTPQREGEPNHSQLKNNERNSNHTNPGNPDPEGSPAVELFNYLGAGPKNITLTCKVGVGRIGLIHQSTNLQFTVKLPVDPTARANCLNLIQQQRSDDNPYFQIELYDDNTLPIKIDFMLFYHPRLTKKSKGELSHHEIRIEPPPWKIFKKRPTVEELFQKAIANNQAKVSIRCCSDNLKFKQKDMWFAVEKTQGQPYQLKPLSKDQVALLREKHRGTRIR